MVLPELMAAALNLCELPREEMQFGMSIMNLRFASLHPLRDKAEPFL